MAKSQKSPPKSDVLDNKELSMKEYVVEKLTNKFVDTIPVEAIRELPPTYMYIFGTLANVGLLITFVLFVYQESSSGNCSPVVRPASGTYMGTSLGIWSGSFGFLYTQAEYILSLYNYGATQQQYSEMMNYFYMHGIAEWGLQSTTQNLAANLLIWMGSTVIYQQGTSKQVFELAGDPSIVFNSEYLFGGMANGFQYCSAIDAASYDVSTSTFYLSYDSQSYKSLCNLNIPMDAFASFPNVSSFTISVDMRSLVTALAVNMGYLPPSMLEPVHIPFTNYTDMIFVIDGQEMITVQAFDPRYPSMNNIMCYYKVNSDQTLDFSDPKCLLPLSFNGIYGLPIMNHLGYDIGRPSYCNCSHPEAYQPNCNSFWFTSGLILFESDVAMANLLLTKTTQEINELAYRASLVASTGGLNPDLYINNDSFRLSAFDFCDHACSVVSWATVNTQNQAVSDYYYQVQEGSCVDSFNSKYWQDLASNPPVQLTENYYECTNTFLTALLSATGVAAGNTSTIVPIILTLLLPFIYLYMRSVGYTPPKQEYTQEQFHAMSKLLCLQLLRAKDGKTRALKKHGHIVELAREMKSAVTAASGYPDSDDEDDEDDVPATRNSAPFSKDADKPTSINAAREALHGRSTSRNPLNTSAAPIGDDNL